MIRLSFYLIFAIAFFSACKKNLPVAIISNPHSEILGERVMEIEASEISSALESPYFYITNQNGDTVPSQLTFDQKIIFPANPLTTIFILQILHCLTIQRFLAMSILIDVTISLMKMIRLE